MYEDEDNDGSYPDESPVEVRYPAASRRSRATVSRRATTVHTGKGIRPAGD